MKSKMLIATALASLLAGAGMAGAQGINEGGHKAPGASGAASSTTHAQSQSERAQSGNRMGQPEGSRSNNHMGQSEPKNSGKTDRLDAQKSGTTSPSAQNEKNRMERNPSATENERGRNPSAQNGQNRMERNPSATENERGRNERNGAAENKNLNERNGAAENRGRAEENRGTAEHPTSASLSTEQRTRIRTTVLGERNAPRIARSDINNIDLGVGVRIPRDRLRIRPLPLPESVVEVEPRWRGYDYFLVGDEIVVVDPNTFEVVAIIPA